MTYTEALDYIHSVAWRGSRPGLSRTNELLEKLGSPEKDMRFIHVAGTNGKGSVCSMLDSALRAAGYRTGLYTSPYIERFNERMRVDGADITDAELAELTAEVRPIADSMTDRPTEFELITAIAFLFFKRRGCDVVVLEVGMGGRLDSTNVIAAPLVSVITVVALDHTAVLGDTVEKIAFEKAGIIKKGRPVVYGGRDDAAFGVIKDRAAALGCAVVRTDTGAITVKEQTVSGTLFDYGGLTDLKISLCGTYQPENAAAAVETLRILRSMGFAVTEKALRAGLASAVWHARFELLSDKDPVAVFDGSHNPQGINAACDSAEKLLGGRAVLLMGVLADKDYSAMVKRAAAVSQNVFTVAPPSPRALPAEDLAAAFGALGVPASPGDIKSAVAGAVACARASGLPLLMLGSLYMYGEVKKAFFEAKNSAE